MLALDFLELDRTWAPHCRRQPVLACWLGLGLGQDLGNQLLPGSSDSLSLEIELLLLVPDVLDVRDMADLEAGLEHIRQVQRLQVKTQGAAAYLNRAAEVSMLSNMVTIRDGCNVQRSSRSCSDAAKHSLMLPCMK